MKSIFTFAFLLFASVASAQVTPASQLAWDQPNTNAAEAMTYTYKYTPANSTTPITLTNVTCSVPVAGGPVVCVTPFPAFTPGAHSITLVASNAAGSSLPSNPFSFQFVVVPSTPLNIRAL